MRFFCALRQIVSIEPNQFHYSDPITAPLDIEGSNAGFYLKGERSFWTLEALIDVMDAFVLMHEVTHIIDQLPFGEERVVKDEIDADMWAISGVRNYLDNLKERFGYIEDRVLICAPMMVIMITTLISEIKTLYDNSIKDPDTEKALSNNLGEAYQRLYGVVYSARRLKLWSALTHGSTDIYFKELVLIYMSLFGRHFLPEYFEDRARANCPLFDAYLDEGDAKGAEAAWIYSGNAKQTSQQIGRAENYVNGSFAEMIAFAGTGINVGDSELSNLLFANLGSDFFSL
jgi:hypothetical protein